VGLQANKFPAFIALGSSFSYSTDLSTGHFPEPDVSIPDLEILFLILNMLCMTVITYFHFGRDAVLLEEQTYVSLKKMVSSTWCTIREEILQESLSMTGVCLLVGGPRRMGSRDAYCNNLSLHFCDIYIENTDCVYCDTIRHAISISVSHFGLLL
jgi:hypothetical protein